MAKRLAAFGIVGDVGRRVVGKIFSFEPDSIVTAFVAHGPDFNHSERKICELHHINSLPFSFVSHTTSTLCLNHSRILFMAMFEVPKVPSTAGPQRNLNDICFSIDGLAFVQGIPRKRPGGKSPKKLPSSNVDNTLHRTKKATGTFNPPSNFSKTDIWGPKFKPRKTLIHAKKRRISIS